METYVVIVAGGKGSRMAAGSHRNAPPKQFLPLRGKAVLQHSIEAFHRVDPTFKYLVVLPGQHIEYWQSHCDIKNFRIPHTVIKGGDERFYSVRNALEQVPGNSLVLIHDGVRPLVGKQTIKRVIETARQRGTAVPVIPVVESLRKTEESHSVAVDRQNYFIVQTPQGFSAAILKKAYEQVYNPAFTDDASVVEKTGVHIHLVEGNRENIKITDPFDLALAEFLMKE